jgi:hypothetical protein
MRNRVDRLERRARPKRPAELRFFRYENGRYTPCNWPGGRGPAMTPDEFERWQAAHPDVTAVVERIVTRNSTCEVERE